MLRMTAFALVGLIMAACSGKVIMSPLDPVTIATKYAATGDERHVEGIIVYRAKPMVEVDIFIHINVQTNPAKTDSPLILSDKCKAFFFKKIVSVADAAHQYRRTTTMVGSNHIHSEPP